jgi:hypothetical protein
MLVHSKFTVSLKNQPNFSVNWLVYTPETGLSVSLYYCLVYECDAAVLFMIWFSAAVTHVPGQAWTCRSRFSAQGAGPQGKNLVRCMAHAVLRVFHFKFPGKERYYRGKLISELWNAIAQWLFFFCTHSHAPHHFTWWRHLFMYQCRTDFQSRADVTINLGRSPAGLCFSLSVLYVLWSLVLPPSKVHALRRAVLCCAVLRCSAVTSLFGV